MQDIIIGKNPVSVAELIGKGGEGEVYAIKGRSGQAVKIYNANLRSKRESKVRAMVGEGLAIKTDLIAYPGEVVTDSKGNFLGFVMRLVSGYHPLHELYGPKSRMRHFPKADYRFLIHAALNVARAVGKVHQTGCVIGDLNHSGILVAPDATVALIDADSFQFRLNGKSYPCVVGVPDFTPPELHGKNLATVERTIAHDNFGLAVAIFHLLFMGKHPYAGIRKGPETSMGEDIAQNRFAYSLLRSTQTQSKPPPGALTLIQFPDVMSRMFETAFGLTPGARPSALDWVHSLNKLEGSLSRCGKVKTHYYPSTAKGCVWCKLTTKSGLDMFPDLSAVSPNIPTDTRGTEQAIHEILAFKFPTLVQILPPPVVPNSASIDLKQAQIREQEQNRKTSGGILLIAVAIIGGFIAGGAIHPAFFLLSGAGLLFGPSLLPNAANVDKSKFLQAFKNADERVQYELDAFMQRNGLIEVMKTRSNLNAVISAYKGHDDVLAREAMILKSKRESRQRQAYLDRFSVRRANISGIGPAKTAMLISFGIETAADVNSFAVQSVPGFGDVMTDKIVAWRKAHEMGFRYDRTPNAQDAADDRALRGRFAAEKAKLESTIRNGLGALRNAKVKLDSLPARARGDKTLLGAITKRAQVERDLKELGESVPASTVGLISTRSPHPSTQPLRAPKVTAQTGTAGVAGTPNCQFCGKRMVKRTARRGQNAGNQFWGCSGYPHCKGTRNISGKYSYNP